MEREWYQAEALRGGTDGPVSWLWCLGFLGVRRGNHASNVHSPNTGDIIWPKDKNSAWACHYAYGPDIVPLWQGCDYVNTGAAFFAGTRQ